MPSKDLIDTLIAEAGGEGEAGLIAAAWAIQQRAAARGQTVDQVIKSGFDGYSNPGSGSRRAQQDPAMRAKVERIVQGVQDGSIPNPVPGADHFLSGDVMPSWANKMDPVATIGGHRFYASGNVPDSAYGPLVPPADIPNTVGTALSTVPTPPRTVMPPMPSAPSRGMQMQRDQNAALADRLAQAEPDPAPNNLTAPGAIDAMFASLPKLPASLPSVPGASDRVRGNEQQTRNTATTIATYPTTAPPSISDMMRGRNGYETIASIPSVPQPMPSASDRVRGSNGYQTIATIPSTPVGQPPATRMVQSVPMPQQAQQVSASDMARGRNGYQTIASIPSRPQSYAGQDAAPAPSQQFTRAAAFSGGAPSPYAGMVPPITSLPPLPALDGFDVANKDQSRLVAGQYPMAPGGIMPEALAFGQMPPMPYARPTRATALPPMPQARPQYAQPQQQRRAPLPSLFRPVTQQRQPARIVVQQATPINTNNHSPAQLEAMREGRSYFTASDNGVQPVRAMNGKLVNNY